MRGLDYLQKRLDNLPPEDPSCRDAWCGYWERCCGLYEMHLAHEPDVPPERNERPPSRCVVCGEWLEFCTCNIIPPETGSGVLQYDGSSGSAGSCGPTGPGGAT
jgi:hypothetical protein